MFVSVVTWAEYRVPMHAVVVVVRERGASVVRAVQLHVCLLRSLAWHDSRAMRARRKLDLGHLDETTWKDYLWEYMRYVGALAWWRQHIIRRAPEQPLLSLRDGTARTAPRPTAAAAAVPDAPEWCSRMRELFSMDYYPQRLTMRDYNELDAVDRAAMLTLLTDASLESPSVKDEVERRVNLGLMHAGLGGEGGACPMRSQPDGDGGGAPAEVPPEEDVYDGCVLCTQVGDLVRCDGCRAPFHMACLGYSNNPIGAWMCPECSMGGRGECAGAALPLSTRMPRPPPRCQLTAPCRCSIFFRCGGPIVPLYRLRAFAKLLLLCECAGGAAQQARCLPSYEATWL